MNSELEQPQESSDLPPYFSSLEHSLNREREDTGRDQAHTHAQILMEKKKEKEKPVSNSSIGIFERNEIHRRHSSFFEESSNKTMLKEHSSHRVSNMLGIYMEDSIDSSCVVRVG